GMNARVRRTCWAWHSATTVPPRPFTVGKSFDQTARREPLSPIPATASTHSRGSTPSLSALRQPEVLGAGRRPPALCALPPRLASGPPAATTDAPPVASDHGVVRTRCPRRRDRARNRRAPQTGASRADSRAHGDTPCARGRGHAARAAGGRDDA